MTLDDQYPGISDLRDRARKRIPHFAWEWLDSATGDESTHLRNQTKLDAIRFKTGVLTGPKTPDLTTQFMGRTLSLPVGFAPVGMSGLLWPNAEQLLARTAAESDIPNCLSTVSAATPEDVGPHVGDQGWFQLYPPGDVEIRRDLLKRAKDSGFHTMVLTVDVAVASRRERQRRASITQPMRITPKIIAQAAICPTWALGMSRIIAKQGIPKLHTLQKYADVRAISPGTAHIGYKLRSAPDWDYLAALKEEWDGPVIVKGVMDSDAAGQIVQAGADAVWVSNHGGRQFGAGIATIEALPSIRAAVGEEYPVIFDGGIRSGTDVLRAVGLGADLVMLGRAPHYALGALGEIGPAHLLSVLKASMESDMGQMGIERPTDARHMIVP